MIEIARAVKTARPKAVICAGGYLPSLAYDRLLKNCPGLDFVVRGEGETVALDVFGRIADGKNWHDAPGVAYLDGENVVANPSPPMITDLDSLPFPARDAIRDAVYPMDSAGVATSRGCYHNCSFCSLQVMSMINGGKIPRFRSPESVIAEVEEIVRTLGITNIRFVDDDFVGPGRKTKERALQIAQGIKDLNKDIKFRIECRVDEVDEDILRTLKDAGLTDVYLGVESGVQRQLETFNKRTKVEQNKAAIALVKSVGLNLRCGFIMFDPYSTVQEIQENMKFCKETGLDKDAAGGPAPLITGLKLFHGVPLIEKLREDGLLVDNGFDLSYKFKDPAAGMMFKTALASGKFSGIVKRVKSLFGGKKAAE